MSSKFLKAFDSASEKHVRWLGAMFDMAESLTEMDAHNGMVAQVNNNPLGVKLENNEALDWPHIHFALSATYARDVWKGKAWLPPKN